MRINNIIVCESSQTIPLPDGGFATILNKPLPEIESEFIPGLYYMTLSFGLSDLPVDGFHLIQASIEDDNGKKIFGFESSPTNAAISKEAMKGSLTCCVDIRNLRIPKEGEYKISINVDGTIKTEYFGVRKKCVK